MTDTEHTELIARANELAAELRKHDEPATARMIAWCEEQIPLQREASEFARKGVVVFTESGPMQTVGYDADEAAMRGEYANNFFLIARQLVALRNSAPEVAATLGKLVAALETAQRDVRARERTAFLKGWYANGHSGSVDAEEVLNRRQHYPEVTP